MDKLVCVEEHYSSPAIKAKIQKIIGAEGAALASATETDRLAADLGAGRIAYMDAVGVTTQLLSCADEYPSLLPPQYAARLCRELNDEMHRAAEAQPGRYACLAALPLGSPAMAADELERCVKELHFAGAMLIGHYESRPYDDEWYFPIFRKAEELDVPVYMHPCKVDPAIADKYYNGAWSPQCAALLSGFGIGWHYDVGMQAVRMMLAGVFDRLPRLKIILGHWGEVVAFYMHRLDEIPQAVTHLNKPLSRYFKENVYVNPSGMMYEEQFRFCMATFGAEHILWGEDYPYRRPDNIRTMLEKLDISESERDKIAYLNAQKLLHL